MYELFTFDLGPDARPTTSQPFQPVATGCGDDSASETDNALIPIIKHRPSQMSQMSLVARYMALDPNARDIFEERAAILQFEAGFSRADAERRAFALVMERYRDG